MRTINVGSLLLLALSLLAGQAAGASDPTALLHQGWRTVRQDYLHFYTGERWIRLGAAFAVGGVLANTNLDQDIRNGYQDHVRSSGTDRLSDAFRGFGESKYLLPASVAAAGVGLLFPQSEATSAIGNWGQHAARAYLVGGPALLVLETATGGSRPGSREDASHWRPFQASHGLSGHAFIGAVPFLTIARMNRTPLIRYAAYAASALPAFSRINDDKHFASQVLLGWYLAFESTDAVFDSDAPRKDYQVSVRPWMDGAALRLSYRW